MAGIEVSQKALKELQESVNDRAKDLVKLKSGTPAADWNKGALKEFGGDFPAKAPESKIFGKLDNADEMTAAVEGVEKNVSEQLGTAKNRLDGVERAVDTVRTNISKANTASGAKD